MNIENNKFFNTYCNVIFCFGLGLSFCVVVEYLCDSILGTEFIEYWPQAGYLGLIHMLFGCFGVAWAIRDGQFIDHIKASHWSYKQKNQ